MTELNDPDVLEGLLPRPAPYMQKLGPYRYLWYRKNKSGPGTWGAKMQRPGSKRKLARLGSEDELSYSEATVKADAWFSSGGVTTEIVDRNLTVRVVASRYLTWRHNERSESGYRSTRDLFNQYLFPHPIADYPVATTTTEQWQSWLNELGERQVRANKHPEPEERRRRGRYVANVCWSFVRASLYRAAKTHKTLPTGEWKAVERLAGGESAAREIWLDEVQVRRLLAAIEDEDFYNLALAAALTGARPGELKSMKVRDLNLREGTWKPSKSKTKNGKRLRFLDQRAVDLLAPLCAGKAPVDYVLTHRGNPWRKQGERLMRDAVKVAQLDPGTCLYSLRHSYISKQLKAGALPQAIAENCGTSVRQIELSYGHFSSDEKRRMLALGTMDLPLPEANIAKIA